MRYTLLTILLSLALTACQNAGTSPEPAPAMDAAGGTTCSVAADPSVPTCDSVAAAEDAPATTVAPTGANPRDATRPTPTSLAEGYANGAATLNPGLNCPAEIPWFFPNPASECATPPLNTWAVMQSFQGGLMVWTQEGGLTYVFVDDKAPFKPYTVLVDTVGIPLPESDPAIVPPPDLTQPVLGLAKFWRGLVPGSEWVRESLGWATAPESGYSALWQCNDASDPTARCYFTGPRDEIIAVTQGEAGFWTYVQGPVR